MCARRECVIDRTINTVHAEPQIELGLAWAAKQGQQRAFGLVLLCLLTVIGVFAPTFIQMVRVWSQSSSYTHSFLVLPLVLFLIWQRRANLAATPLRPFLPAAILAAGAGFVWLVAELASAVTPGFFAVVSLMPLTVAAVLGWRWAKVVIFPLALLFFAVPFGELFVPTLMQWTADFTVSALRISGVPVYRDGQNFVIPSGSWSVIEACSGVRYLLASTFAGALYAWQMYRSPVRRAAFFIASIFVPIVANWLRAYLIVMLGHLSDNRIATGVDHLIYGWIFFGVVIVAMFAVGAIWREDHLPQSHARALLSANFSADAPAVHWPRVGQAAMLTVAILLVWPVAASLLAQPLAERSLPALDIESRAGWTRIAAMPTSWRPQLQAPAREREFAFEKNGQKVGVYVGVYRNQRQGSELVSSMNRLIPPDSEQWISLATGVRSIEFDRHALSVRTERFRGPNETFVAWRWYQLGTFATASDVRAKLDLALDRLLRRDDTSAWVAVYVMHAENPREADRMLAQFAGEMGGALEQALQGAVAP